MSVIEPYLVESFGLRFVGMDITGFYVLAVTDLCHLMTLSIKRRLGQPLKRLVKIRLVLYGLIHPLNVNYQHE